MIDSIEKEKCTGCKMCKDICPDAAISYETDQEGFWYPAVDYDKCSKCGLCMKTCPSLAGHKSHKNYKESPAVYAAWSRDEEIRLGSTSGGIYAALAGQFLSNGGSIAGCRYQEDWKGACHGIYSSTEGLQRLMGSKYFQSDTDGIYKEIKTLLDDGRKVLFCGAPCQSAALQNFIWGAGLSSDAGWDAAGAGAQSGLLTVDFVCRGVASPKVYSRYITELEENFESAAVSVRMKSKREGWESLGFLVRFQNGREYYRRGREDLFVQGFLDGNLYSRPACHTCRYRNIPRVSDISLGDFWGIRGAKKRDRFKGISLVMVNSHKGERLLDGIGNSIVCERRTVAEAVKSNPSLLTDSPPGNKRKLFFELLDSMGVSGAVTKCLEDTGNLIQRAGVGQTEDRKKEKDRDLNKDTRAFTAFQKLKAAAGRASGILSSVNLIKFVYYNFVSKSVIREKGSFLIPYKNSIIDLHKTARIEIKNGTIHLGASKLRGSRAETYLWMGENARWKSGGGAHLLYNTQIEIKRDAVLETGYFSANCGTVMVCAKKITLGENIMMGRNIIIYDSDHHQIIDRHGIAINPDEAVTIGGHVWLTSDVTVLRGSVIGEGSIVTAQTVVKKGVPSHSLVSGGNVVKITSINKIASWSRESATGQGGILTGPAGECKGGNLL